MKTTDIIGELITMCGDKFGALERSKDGAFIAKEFRGVWFIKPTAIEAMEALLKHVKLGMSDE